MWFYWVFFIGCIVAAIISTIVVKNKSVFTGSGAAEAVCGISYAGAIISFILVIVLNAAAEDMALDIVEDHAELQTYYEVVDESYNEYVRYDFKMKVDNYNKGVDNYYKYSENFLLKPFFTLDKIGFAKPIYFELRTDEVPTPMEEPTTVSVG